MQHMMNFNHIFNCFELQKFQSWLETENLHALLF